MPSPSNPALAILLGAMKGVVGNLPTVYDNLKAQNNPAPAHNRALGSITGAVEGGFAGESTGSLAGDAETSITGGALGGAGDQLGSANVNIKNSQSQHRRQQVVAAVGDHDYYYKF